MANGSLVSEENETKKEIQKGYCRRDLKDNKDEILFSEKKKRQLMKQGHQLN